MAQQIIHQIIYQIINSTNPTCNCSNNKYSHTLCLKHQSDSIHHLMDHIISNLLFIKTVGHLETSFKYYTDDFESMGFTRRIGKNYDLITLDNDLFKINTKIHSPSACTDAVAPEINYGVCCFCKDQCNPCSQACGRCTRNH